VGPPGSTIGLSPGGIGGATAPGGLTGPSAGLAPGIAPAGSNTPGRQGAGAPLVRTGFEAWRLVLTGLLCVLLGSALCFAARRRPQ